jgi:cell division septation protein DedD
MKTCSYCGASYPDDTQECPIDQTPLAAKPAAAATATGSPPASETPRAEFEFAPLSAAQRQQDWVTLVSCGTLISADLVVSRLRAAGIDAFIPDENLMQSIGFNLNTFGFVRVQVTPDDYDQAKGLLSESRSDA